MRKHVLELSNIGSRPEPRARDRRPGADSPALLLDRFLAHPADASPTAAAEKRALLHAAVQSSCGGGLHTIFGDAFARWNDSFPGDDLNLFCDLSTTGRLIVGLGSENVLETGIRLHHIYGVPLVPGSALKGLASHYCHQVWGQPNLGGAAGDDQRPFRRPSRTEDEEYRKALGGQLDRPAPMSYFRLLFGNTEDSGVITFHDAWITPESLRSGALHLDVITPHHPDWQVEAANARTPPADFDSPIPISFLSVTGTFRIRISWCGPVETPPEQAQAWTLLAMTLLQQAFAEWGVGGKTSSGYGRLVARTDSRPASGSTAAPRRTPEPPQAGSQVTAVLLEEKTRKGGWKARHEPSGLSGPIQNSSDVPGDHKPDDSVTLDVAFANEREIGFRYPTPASEQSRQQAMDKPKRSPGQRGASERR